MPLADKENSGINPPPHLGLQGIFRDLGAAQRRPLPRRAVQTVAVQFARF